MLILFKLKTALEVVALALFLLAATRAAAQVPALPELEGAWRINQELSDDTDRQVEKSLRAAGQKIQRGLFDNREDRYRGGPEEQELYDHISYDRQLTIAQEEDAFLFTYDDGYRRQVFTDGRSRAVSLSNIGEVKDFSMAHWNGEELLVEARPRDGGFAHERYSLSENGSRLRVQLHIEPRTFTEPIEIVRVYDRQGLPASR